MPLGAPYVTLGRNFTNGSVLHPVSVQRIRSVAGLTDRELLSRLRTDPAALEQLYRRHVRRLVSYAARRCREPQDVADAVATTFVAVLESAHTFDPSRGEVLPWILGIERNLLAENGRRAAREHEVLIRALGQRTLVPDEFAELEERIDAARDSAQVERALATLDPAQREVLALVGHDGLDSGRAAALLGISRTAFRMRLSRARRALKEALT
jgi:RNA polymerase sigma factor (sigma-70 family)